MGYLDQFYDFMQGAGQMADRYLQTGNVNRAELVERKQSFQRHVAGYRELCQRADDEYWAPHLGAGNRMPDVRSFKDYWESICTGKLTGNQRSAEGGEIRAYVGSKKYYLPTFPGYNRYQSGQLVTFPFIGAAAGAGYRPAVPFPANSIAAVASIALFAMVMYQTLQDRKLPEGGMYVGAFMNFVGALVFLIQHSLASKKFEKVEILRGPYFRNNTFPKEMFLFPGTLFPFLTTALFVAIGFYWQHSPPSTKTLENLLIGSATIGGIIVLWVGVTTLYGTEGSMDWGQCWNSDRLIQYRSWDCWLETLDPAHRQTLFHIKQHDALIPSRPKLRFEALLKRVEEGLDQAVNELDAAEAAERRRQEEASRPSTYEPPSFGSSSDTPYTPPPRDLG